MKYEFHPEALDEFEAAARYYAGSQPGFASRPMASDRMGLNMSDA
jgi:3-oxoacyl-(acyl-carrier-protein) synthase